jgi:hypothetical protein
MKKILFFLSVFIYTNVSSQQYWNPKNSYICIPSQSTGFSYNKNLNKWVISNFNVEGKKYFVKKLVDGYKWSEFGSQNDTFCNNSLFTEKFGWLSCKLIDGSLELQMSTLKYIKTHNFGYIDGSTENTLTPYIEMGTCSSLD